MIKIKLLILGANSFLGSNFLSQIIKNKNIECFATININDFRIKRNYYKANKIIKINLLDEEKITRILHLLKPNILINFSGTSNKFANKKECSLNIKIVKNILHSIIKSKIKIKHFYNIGSSEEYVDSKKLISENSKIGSNNYYGKSKIQIHKTLIQFSKIKKINCTNLRTFNVLGKDTKKNNIINYIKKNINKKIIFKNINSERDYMWIGDFLTCIEKIVLNNNKNYQAINIGTGKGTTIYKILEICKKSHNLKINLKKIKNENKVYSFEKKITNINRLKKIISTNKFLIIDETIKKII